MFKQRKKSYSSQENKNWVKQTKNLTKNEMELYEETKPN